MSQAENASSTTASRRDALLGLAAVSAAAVPVIRAARATEFDPHFYLERMRAMGSRFYIMRDLTTGKDGLCEEYPDDGWTEGQLREQMDLCREYRACPNGKQRLKAVLIDEGNVVLYS